MEQRDWNIFFPAPHVIQVLSFLRIDFYISKCIACSPCLSPPCFNLLQSSHARTSGEDRRKRRRRKPVLFFPLRFFNFISDIRGQRVGEGLDERNTMDIIWKSFFPFTFLWWRLGKSNATVGRWRKARSFGRSSCWKLLPICCYFLGSFKAPLAEG